MKKSLLRQSIIVKSMERFIQIESSSGILLAICAVLALIIANSPFSTAYFDILNHSLFGLSLQLWINDGLMAIFFFVVGLEIKRELISGELSTAQKAALPVAAALGGMIAPALIYAFFNAGTPDLHGWAIPMATDIAFALAVLTLFGNRVPLSLKIFLLALAIVDDLGAVLVIAFFYTAQIKWLGLALAAVALGIVQMARIRSVSSYWIYIFLGSIFWTGFMYSGVHPTIAGVILGLCTPSIFTRRQKEDQYSPIDELIHTLHPWVSYLIMPVFALANAGVALKGMDLRAAFTDHVTAGVALGLLLGKPIGITLFSWIAVKAGLARLPSELRWPHVMGVSVLAAIGFTMSIFIANLALSDEKIMLAKGAIIAASTTAGIIGWFILHHMLKPKHSQ